MVIKRKIPLIIFTRSKDKCVYLANTRLILDSILRRYYFLRETDNKVALFEYIFANGRVYCIDFKKKKKGVITEGFHAYFIPEHLLRYLKRRKKKRAAIIIIILISINI